MSEEVEECFQKNFPVVKSRCKLACAPFFGSAVKCTECTGLLDCEKSWEKCKILIKDDVVIELDD